MSCNSFSVLTFALGSCGLFGQHSPTWDAFFQEGQAAVARRDYFASRASIRIRRFHRDALLGY